MWLPKEASPQSTLPLAPQPAALTCCKKPLTEQIAKKTNQFNAKAKANVKAKAKAKAKANVKAKAKIKTSAPVMHCSRRYLMQRMSRHNPMTPPAKRNATNAAANPVIATLAKTADLGAASR